MLTVKLRLTRGAPISAPGADHEVIKYGPCRVSEPLRHIFFELLETSEAHHGRVRHLDDLNDVPRLGKLAPQCAVEKSGKLLGPLRWAARIDRETQTGRRVPVLTIRSAFSRY